MFISAENHTRVITQDNRDDKIAFLGFKYF